MSQDRPLNLYATATRLSPAPDGVTVRSARDRSTPELEEHLHGFSGFVQQSLGMRDIRTFRLVQHILHTQHHLVIEGEFTPQLSAWAAEQMAIFFAGDSTVRDPHGRVLVGPEPEDDAAVPVAEDARAALEQARAWCAERGITLPEHLTPGLGRSQAILQDAPEVARRALALFAVAARAETFAEGEALPATRLAEVFGPGLDAFSPEESAFMAATEPKKGMFARLRGPKAELREEATSRTWGYEAGAGLLELLGCWQSEWHPARQAEVPALLERLQEIGPQRLVDEARLPEASQLLLLQARIRGLHWAIRQAIQVEGHPPPDGTEPGPVAERHRALNWVTGQWAWSWDEVDTPS